MQKGIGEGRTRADHRTISNDLYKYYARGRDLRRLEAIVGRDGMTESDKRILDFTDAFEREFLDQGTNRRNFAETLDTGMAIVKKFGLAS
jgi:V/A-type H+-transporting ATPase subunit B